MKYKLLALDLDDTLLDAKAYLAPEIAAKVREISQQGVRVIVATGRMLVSAQPYIEALGLQGPMITYNGALVKDISRGEVLYHRPIPFELAREIITDAREMGLHINLYQDDQLFVEKRNQEARSYEKLAGIKAIEVGPLTEFLSGEATKLLLVISEPKQHEAAWNFFQRKYGDKVHITRSKNFFIEFMAQGVSKGVALAELSRKLGISQQQVVAAGDSWNDLEMIQWAGLGVAMAHSPDELKKAADLVAPEQEKGGLGQVLLNIFTC